MPAVEDVRVLDRGGLDRLVEVLLREGYRVVGPMVRDDAIVLGELTSSAALPAGWGVETAPGRYRLRRRDDAAVFGHSAGPQSWKRFLHPPHRALWSTGPGGEFVPAEEPGARQAFLGVRACDLAAIAVLGKVLAASGAFARRRAGLFTVAANCTEPGEVCFCASLGTGPGASAGYDLALTERIDDRGHRFLVDVGSPEGARILALVTTREAADDEVALARDDVAAAAGKMGRALPPGDLRALLRDSRDSPVWSEIASRCLTCGNCTMVCPTCFCTSTEEVTDVTGEHTGRAERWASCFELDFSYVHGGSVRTSGEGRYRQWMSHKLGTWHDQFGTSGCVGCGRCIAWCPAGIDITAEAAKLAGEGAGDAGR
ncbi:4Fe-4S dicluster domain-containing protein [Amycolatopsis sp. NPDC049252]|uniref:4Fe-4S dicluster domain-containing protein n=1 Tax=Amycolatopsis sp. NPDC049252 TaxID=3363933 RepID=UPI00370FB1A0